MKSKPFLEQRPNWVTRSRSSRHFGQRYSAARGIKKSRRKKRKRTKHKRTKRKRTKSKRTKRKRTKRKRSKKTGGAALHGPMAKIMKGPIMER